MVNGVRVNPDAAELSMLREFYNTWIAYHTGPVEERENNGYMLLDWHNALQAQKQNAA